MNSRRPSRFADVTDGDETAPSTDREPAVSVRNLTKTFGDGDDAIRAVDSVSFSIEPGNVVGLLGPNGAGKTTTIKSILGLIVPTEGDVLITGIDTHEQPRKAYENISVMLEGARNIYWRLTVRENLEFFARLAGEDPRTNTELIDRLLERFDLVEKESETVNDLSRGQKQKVALATTLSQDTDVLFLDEPTLGLDVESSIGLREELDRYARQRDITVILSSHDMDVIERLCDRVILLDDGGIVADDSVDDLLDLFRTQAYEITVDGNVPTSVRTEFERDYDEISWTDRADRTTLEVSLPDGNAIRPLVDSVVDAGFRITAINTVEPDFEDVFLSLTDDRTDTAAGPTGRTGMAGSETPMVGGGDDA